MNDPRRASKICFGNRVADCELRALATELPTGWHFEAA